MSLFKKILYLLVIFLILNIITIYNFDYSSTNSNKENIFSSMNKKISSFFSKESKNIPFNFSIEKSNDILVLNGLFPNNDDLKIVLNSLGVNQEGNSILFEDGVVIDYPFLERVKPFIDKFKEESINGAKIIYNSEGLKVIADINSQDGLKELENISLKNNLNASLNIKAIVKDQETIEKQIEEVKSIVEKDVAIDKADIPETVTIIDVQNKINSILKENKITFARASTNLTPESIKIVEEIANILKEYDYDIEVGGHTDSKGNPNLNQQLSDKRAASVKDVLIKFGVNKDSIKSFGYGNKFPIAQEDELGLSEENRRVEILLKEKGVK